MPTSDHALHTFGDHLDQFAQTVDIVTDEVYRDVLLLVERYFRQNLDSSFFAVVVEKIHEAKPWLVGEWPERRWWNKPMREGGDYSCQVALAYETGKMLWIVGKDAAGRTGAALGEADSYEDLLKRVGPDRIPKYAQIEEEPSRTSVIIPLVVEDTPFGVINVESKRRLKPTPAWRQELEKLAKAVAILNRLKETYKLQIRSTQEAKHRLEHGSFVPVVASRRMFLACSSRADDEVIGIMKEVFSDHEEDFELDHWTVPETGNIHEKIWERLSACTFGTCYFSEPAEGTTHRFRDNPNVLFEAGMLFALRTSKRSPVRALLLVRERDAPDTPFDLSAEYMVVVPRQSDRSLNKEAFRTRLTHQIGKILEEDK
jgi:hypothetical protein